jgi:phosphoribosyl-ATP pyrophosphohydrolase/phosphoribosyl-AMP cyclohydrolase
MDWAEFTTQNGLVPAIVQDAKTGQVLMLAYMNEESYRKTLDTGLVTFYSRSREQLWTKGESSGNQLHYVDHAVDCDRDTLLVRAIPVGPVCHTGSRTCFTDSTDGALGFLGTLESVIASREDANPSESYTARLLQDEGNATARKVGEEGLEVAMAALSESDERLAEESADLLYHLLVVLRSRGLSLADVLDVLEARHRPAG